MTQYTKFAAPLARVLLSLMFITAGFAKLGDPAGNAAYTASGGIPGFFVWPAMILEIVGGIAILVGFQARLAAVLLAGFTLVASVLYHLIPALSMEGMNAMMQQLMFMKNLAVTGGLLFVFSFGAGVLSFDNKGAAA